MRGIQLVLHLVLKHSILCLHNVDSLNICMKKFDAKKLARFFLFAFKILFVHIQGNQIVTELLLKLSDSLH